MTEHALTSDATETDGPSQDAAPTRPAALGWRRWLDVMATANDHQVPF